MSIKNVKKRIIKLKIAKEAFIRRQTELNLKKLIGLMTYMARSYQEIKSTIRPVHTWINNKQYNPVRKVKINKERRKILNKIVTMIAKAKPKCYSSNEEAKEVLVDASDNWIGISDG